MAITRRVIFEVEDFFSLAPHFLLLKKFFREVLEKLSI